MALNREDILKATDIPREMVNVPEWGGAVWVKGLTGAERDKFEASIIEQHGNQQTLHLDNVRAKLCALSICDEDGNLIFNEKDIYALSAKSASALSRVFMAAKKLSGIGDEEVNELTEGMKRPFGDSVSG